MKNIEKTMELMANGMTISKALAEVYETRKIHIPFKREKMDIPLTELTFSNRIKHCFEAANFKSLIEVIDYIEEHGWIKIRGFGKTSATEVFEKILDVAWEKLNIEERAAFLLLVNDENKARRKL